MAVLNKVQLIGHMGHSPRSTQTKENHLIVSVSLATNESHQMGNHYRVT